ncbi:MAG: hypothetical protein H7067_09365, partial [Burkholderiales bacterium]|nr:hypothetical protein [Opitutaceae bacterium]
MWPCSSAVFVLTLFLALPVHATTWRALDTGAAAARYEVTLSGWTLVIDSARARLVSAIPPGGVETDNILLGDGHRVWLGPQSEWAVFWPPPRDWESSPAASVTLSADATELTLVLPRSDLRHPALVRRYRLRPDALELVAAWRIEKTDTSSATSASAPAPTSYQAVQILQTRADTVVFLAPRPTPAAPLGHGLLALAVRPGTILDQPIPAGFATPATADAAAVTACTPPALLRLAATGAEEKIAVPPQPLVARFPGGHGLRLLPA